jgi:hypothetical protein
LRAKDQVRRFLRHTNFWLLLATLWMAVVLVRFGTRGELPPLKQFPWWEAVTPPGLFWSRPTAAPNGSPWPAASAYVAGYPRLNVSGRVSLVIDNSGSLDDVFVKVFDRERIPMAAVRVAFVRAEDKFSMGQVTPGHYDVRYLDLTTGIIKKSQPLTVTGERGWIVGLYGVVNGTQQHQVIGSRDF